SHEDTSHGIYRYSYAMNIAYANPVYKKWTNPNSGARVDGVFNGKLSSIRSPGEKILFICEDEKTLHNGVFKPDANGFITNNRVDCVSSRHESRVKRATNLGNTNTVNNEGNEDARGNVGFCDGHGEFFSRKDAMRARYSGSPIADPNNY